MLHARQKGIYDDRSQDTMWPNRKEPVVIFEYAIFTELLLGSDNDIAQA